MTIKEVENKNLNLYVPEKVLNVYKYLLLLYISAGHIGGKTQ